ncbi:MAG TPA: DNA polymerase Y family protein [Rhodospirillaceae bacterium]|nr:DNA polymerase Y family protein [Rhodospirillaceae bacterium]
MRRVVSVWLPWLPTDRLRRMVAAGPADEPLATVVGDGGRQLLAAVDRAARRAGLRPGMTVADAQAVAPGVCLRPADPVADRLLLDHLAETCLRYTPSVAVDGWSDSLPGGGLWLDISGCAHLLGGEAALLAALRDHLRRLGLTARLGLADTPGAAWGVARFGGALTILPPGGLRDALPGLPVTALRLAPDTAAGLVRLGLKRIGDLLAVPRAAVAHRFGGTVARRLDQALGDADEPISPCRPPCMPRVHLAFAEPIARPEDLAAAARRLLDDLTAVLEGRRLGARRLELTAFRVDATLGRLAIGTGRPCRDPGHLYRLLAEPLAGLDAGFGIESMALAAVETGPLDPRQGDFVAPSDGDDLDRLLDALGNRLGFERVYALAPRHSHLPERAVRRVTPPPPPAGEGWGEGTHRPLCLLVRPDPVEAVAALPDGPPRLFRHRGRLHRLRRAEGPERLSAEWWRGDERPDRDYYAVEDEEGRRFWLCRQGVPGRWFLHGVFP